MSENSAPLKPGSAAEGRPGPRSSTAGLHLAIWSIVVATLAVLTANVWLAARLVQEQRSATQDHAFWTLCHPNSTLAVRETAFRQLVAAGNKEWRGADLVRLNLAGFSAPGADLQNALFLRTTLAGANLVGTRFCRSSFELADLSGAALGQADFTEARLLQTTLKDATLRGAKLCASSLQQVQAQNADFVMADISDADCLMADFSGAKLMGANLSGAKLESAVLKGANLSLARLNGANLKNADFTNANWWRARGLTTLQLDALGKQFAPTASAPAALKEDYARWLKGT